MPRCYMMVGLPGSGKSTASNQLIQELSSICSVSSDEYIEKYAKEKGKSYNEVHAEAIEDAEKWMKRTIAALINDKKDFIWDQTNVVKSARLKKIRMLKQHKYEVVAIVVELSHEEHARRIANREQSGGKKIGQKIIDNMRLNYERPTYDEGFSKIILISDDNIPQEVLMVKNTSKL